MKRRGDGTVYQRGRTWWISYLPGPGIPRRSESARTEDRRIAERFLKQRQAAARREIAGAEALGLPVVGGIRTLTVSDLLADYITSFMTRRGLVDEADLPAYLRTRLPHLRKTVVAGRPFGTHDARHADPAAYRRARAAIPTRTGGTRSPGDIDRDLEILASAYRLAHEDPKCRMAVPFIPRFDYSPDVVRRIFVDESDFQRILAKLWKAGEEEMADYARFVRLTGWRPEEVQKLLWSMVHWPENADPTVTLSNEDAKTFGGSLVCGGALREIMERRRARRDLDNANRPRIFHRNGGALTTHSARDAWRKACQDAGHPNIWVKDLNRSTARDLLAAGVPETRAMAYMRRRTHEIFRRYAIVDQRDLVATQESLMRHLTKAASAPSASSRAAGHHDPRKITQQAPHGGTKINQKKLGGLVGKDHPR